MGRSTLRRQGLLASPKHQLSVYTLVPKKPVYQPKISIGSGTKSKGSAPVRLPQHDKSQLIPHHVYEAFDNGYQITYKVLSILDAYPKCRSDSSCPGPRLRN
jgi:hypothetical protein